MSYATWNMSIFIAFIFQLIFWQIWSGVHRMNVIQQQTGVNNSDEVKQPCNKFILFICLHWTRWIKHSWSKTPVNADVNVIFLFAASTLFPYPIPHCIQFTVNYFAQFSSEWLGNKTRNENWMKNCNEKVSLSND